jgi:hypothetical protein
MVFMILDKVVIYTKKIFDTSILKQGDKIHIKYASILPIEYWGINYNTIIEKINEDEIWVQDDYAPWNHIKFTPDQMADGFLVITQGWEDEELIL